jgi:PAS domain S-box-containing protein
MGPSRRQRDAASGDDGRCAAGVRPDALLASIADGFLALDANLHVTYLNAAAAALFGRRAQDVLGRQLPSVLPGVRGTVFESNCRRVVAERAPLSFDVFLEVQRHGDWYDVSVYPAGDGVTVALRITTERKAREEEAERHAGEVSALAALGAALLAARSTGDIYDILGEELRKVVGDTRFYLSCLDEQTQSIYIRTHVNIMGPLVEKLIGALGVDPRSLRAPLSQVSPERMAQFTSGRIATMPNGFVDIAVGTVPAPLCRLAERILGVAELQTIGIAWQGRLFGSVTFMLSAPGALPSPRIIEAMVNQAALALQRRYAEKQLQRALENWRVTFDAITDVVVVMNAAKEIEEVNQAGCRLLGRSAEEWRGRTCCQLLHQRDTPLADCPCSVALRTRLPATFESRIRDRDYVLAAWPVLDADGAVVKFVHIMRDISEQKRVEEERRRMGEQLRQAQKMEAVGVLAGGIAHDFNNILNAIIGYTDLTQQGLAADSREHRNLGHVLTAAYRAAELVRQILTFSRRGEGERTALDLRQIVAEALKLLRSSLPANITIVQEIAPDAPAVRADPTQMHQIVMNLCTNAYQAMTAGNGVLTVALAPVSVSDEEGRQRFKVLLPGRCVRLSVRDTGVGMDERTMSRIFEPFFTTKQPGRGTGLGLSVVHGIVESHGGEIEVESAPGRGTEFRVYLPATDEPVAGVGQVQVPSPLRGSEHVLFVDDEQELAGMAVQALEALGYRVTTHGDGEGARAAFELAPAAFDVLVTDQTMPRLTGLELAGACRSLRPDLPVVLCSGYSNLITPQAIASAGVSHYVTKPYDQTVLAAAVRKALDRAV